MADVASKQQTTALFLSTMVTHKKTHRTDKKAEKPDGKPVLCQKTFSSVFRADFLHSYTPQFNLECMGPLRVPSTTRIATSQPTKCHSEHNLNRSMDQ
jgi:hypothetical protein